MRSLLGFLTILMLALSNLTHAKIGGRMQVAVLNLDTSGIDASAIVVLSDRLRSELVNTGRFDVMERTPMDEILTEQGFQQSGGTITECAAEVGQLLGVA